MKILDKIMTLDIVLWKFYQNKLLIARMQSSRGEMMQENQEGWFIITKLTCMHELDKVKIAYK